MAGVVARWHVVLFASCACCFAAQGKHLIYAVVGILHSKEREDRKNDNRRTRGRKRRNRVKEAYVKARLKLRRGFWLLYICQETVQCILVFI